MSFLFNKSGILYRRLVVIRLLTRSVQSWRAFLLPSSMPVWSFVEPGFEILSGNDFSYQRLSWWTW